MEGRGTGGKATTAILLAALAAVALLAAQWRTRERDLAALGARAAALDLAAGPRDELGRALARESDPGERRLVLARAALAAAVADARPGGADLTARRCEAAHALAMEALADLPGSSDAPRLAGVALALERLARRDPALVTGIGDWERPLELARRRAPGLGGAERALAAAWLEIWPALRGERRQRAASALAEAFRDPRFFERAFDRWLELAGSLEDAAALLPDAPPTWERLTRVAVARGDLQHASALRVRYRAALAAGLAARLERVARLAAETGSADAARNEIDDLLAATPPDAALAPLAERALAERPPGPPSPPLADAAVRWIAWARPLCLLRDCPLSPLAFDRFSGASGGRLGPESAAFAALAAGDRMRAERWARRSDALWSETWAPYLMLAARQRLASGDLAGARDALGQVNRETRLGLAWRRLARAAGLTTAPTSARSWQPTEWLWHAGTPTLAFELDRPASALELALATPPARPALLEISWDGRAAPPVVVPAGAGSIRLPATLAAGVHQVDLTVLAGDMPAFGVTTVE